MTHAETDFGIPALNCGTQSSQLSYWAGMDSGLSGATKAGVQGACSKGIQSWNAFFQTPSTSSQPITELGSLHAGDHVRVQLDYRPDLAADAFVADITVYSPGQPGREVKKTFYSVAGANQRSRADCILERPDTKPVEAVPDFAYFSFSAGCLGGTESTKTALPSIDASSVISNISSKGKLLTEAARLDPGAILFWWASAK